MRSLTLPSASNAPRSSKEAEPIGAPPIPQSRYILFGLIALVGCAIDLLTKHWVFQWRGMPRPGNEWWLWDGYVGIETALNEGALFGMGQGQVALFACLSIIAGLAILGWLFLARAAEDLLLTIALSCVMGGLLGNLYDRMGMWQGPDGKRIFAVRDWILLRYGELTWPNFNFADCLLVCGAALLVWHAIAQGRSERQSAPG